MLRATVRVVHALGDVSVTIDGRYGSGSLIRMPSRVDVAPGARVLVEDLGTDRAHDWVLMGMVTEIGRHMPPEAHTHPMGQVVGLVDALGAKADKTALDGKADKATTPTTADAAGQWVSLRTSLGPGWVPSTYDTTLTQQGVEVKRTLSQVIIDVNLAPASTSTAVSTTMATLPANLRPARSTWMLMPLQGSNNTFGYTIVTYDVKNGLIRLREAPPAGALVRVIGTMVIGL